MVLLLCEALDKAVMDAMTEESPQLNEYQQAAINILTSILRGNVELPVAAVQGPPGTGKTTVVEGFVQYEKGLADYMLRETTSSEIIIYTAPTNFLAWDAFRRVVTALLRKGFSLRDILDLVRVYGSKIKPCRPGYIPRTDEVRKILGKINQLMSREIDVYIVKLIFAVEFQRVSSKFTAKPSRINFIVDEASKTPYYRFLLPVADAIIRSPGTYPASLMVLGDPEQAITVPEEFRDHRVPLLMRKVIYSLNNLGSNIIRKHHVLLQVTYRLPRPSEEPISHGYYDGRLRSYYRLTDRGVVCQLLEIISQERAKIETKLQTLPSIWDEITKKLLDAIVCAYANNIPLIAVNTRRFRQRAIPTFDPRRVEIATRFAAIFSVATDYADLRLGYAITAPYSDLVNTAAYRIRRRLGKVLPKPTTTTVQAMIGNESDIVITMLGKEWSSQVGFDDYETIYAREPEVLNVQLSRHRGLEVIIGDLENLSRFPARKVAKTAKQLLSLGRKTHGAIIVNL